MLSGCVAKIENDVKYGIVTLTPTIQALTFEVKGKVIPNIKFCALTPQEVNRTYEGLSVNSKTGSIIYAFKRLDYTKGPDTWLILQTENDTSNRWPHSYTFDITGNGAADVTFLDMDRDGECDLKEMTGPGKDV
jgi:hypothetical protein